MNGSKRMPRGRISPIAVLAIVMAVVAILPSQHQCGPTVGKPTASKPTENKPNLNDMEVKNVVNEPGRVVANLVGYLELFGDTTTYLPLDLNSISNAKYAHSHSKHCLVMYDDHLDLHLEYHEKDGGNSYEFTEIDLLINNGTESVGWYQGVCKFDEPFVFSLPVGSRYSCQKVLVHSCSKHGKPVVNLVLKSFELELGGDQKKISKGEFSKPAWEESCDHFSGNERLQLNLLRK